MKSAAASFSDPATPPSLSGQLQAIFRNPETVDLTLNELLERTADRGPYGLIILLCLPFLAPFSLPGVSNVFGLVIVMLAWRILRGESARLPRGLGRRKVQGRVLARVVSASIRVLGWVERLTCSRGPRWFQSAAAHRLGALVLVYGGLLLAAPIPPLIPFSNLTPAIGILLVAASMMERDGLMIWAGYAATVGATVYIAAMAALNIHLFQALFRRILG
ncbi:MAG: exopolysaccharide biosynthesis protein [Verrucomicrobiae bacterium]|nr:exopolysaccharide biosynthesis protein [Verrucomicrobiae bacterium]